MSSLNIDLQKIDNKLDMKVDMNSSVFQRILESISKSDLYKNEFFTSSFQHNIYHIQRVMFFSQIIAQNEKICEEDLTLLLWSAALHDSGKTKDRKDFEHGKISAEIAKEYLQNNINAISEEDIAFIQTAIEYHIVQEKGKINIIELERLCQKYNVSVTNLERIKIISAILKDADALDRTRFDKENTLNIDFTFLNNELAKRGFQISNGYGALKNKTFRIGHMGDCSITDLNELLDKSKSTTVAERFLSRF